MASVEKAVGNFMISLLISISLNQFSLLLINIAARESKCTIGAHENKKSGKNLQSINQASQG